ncbi:hypothetical protein LSCM1_07888 [Leishmania martiniquensis]|uniref:J domain-containing protein n=1 Tax=Leishmania martiniquensis TaxID=1580590 RepID=A0A836H2B0_9TRYP|nr:hypothetical protein LSCM1_07888 [Leishmania martiniquensis]
MTDRCYRSLGLHRGAVEEDIKRAYRTKALLLHPDRNPCGGEAFKALHDDYEKALADARRRGAYKSGLPTFSSSPPSDASLPRDSAAPAAGAAYWFARAAGAAHPPPSPSPPLFTEKELFGDSIPGGWRDACAPRGALGRGGHKSGCRSSTKGRTGEAGGRSSTSTREAAAADTRWRRAHGARVPVSAYEDNSSLPHPQPPPSFASLARDGAQFRASAAAAGASSATKAQWDRFLSRERPWQLPPAGVSEADAPGELSGSEKCATAQGCDGRAAENRKSARGSESAESAADRVYREAVFLYRRMTKGAAKGEETAAERMRAYGDSPATSSATRGGCHQRGERLEHGAIARNSSSVKGKDVEAELKGTEQQRPSLRKEATQSRKVGDDGEASANLDKGSFADDACAKSGRSAGAQPTVSSSGEPRASNALPAHYHSAPSCYSDERVKRDVVQQSAMLDERRLMQSAYLRYRYTPSPADLAEMSDMDVFLLASLAEETYHQMRATLAARLSAGPCSCCASAPRARQHLYFSCAHPSVCAGCYALGVLKCPLCGAARATQPRLAPFSAAASSSATERGGSTRASSASTPIRASLGPFSTSSPARMPRPAHAPCPRAAEEAEVRPADVLQGTETTHSATRGAASAASSRSVASSSHTFSAQTFAQEE